MIFLSLRPKKKHSMLQLIKKRCLVLTKKNVKKEKMKKGWKLATELRFAGDPKEEVGPGTGAHYISLG